MPDESGRIRPVSVPRVWPGHRDYEPRPKVSVGEVKPEAGSEERQERELPAENL